MTLTVWKTIRLVQQDLFKYHGYSFILITVVGSQDIESPAALLVLIIKYQ